MKKQILFLIATFLFSSAFTLQTYGQEKTKTDKQKDVMIQKSIEEQKRAMSDQKKAQEMQLYIEKHQSEFGDSLDLATDDIEREALNSARIYMNIPRNRSFREPFVFSGDDMGYFGHIGDEERTSWDFSKSVKDNTFSGDYTFEVDKTSKSVVMSVMGDCKAGEIRIKIIMPNGKSYSDILIDESGNLNWRKSFAISDTENKDKTGNWKFQISSSKATGFFKISLQAY